MIAVVLGVPFIICYLLYLLFLAVQTALFVPHYRLQVFVLEAKDARAALTSGITRTCSRPRFESIRCCERAFPGHKLQIQGLRAGCVPRRHDAMCT